MMRKSTHLVLLDAQLVLPYTANNSYNTKPALIIDLRQLNTGQQKCLSKAPSKVDCYEMLHHSNAQPHYSGAGIFQNCPPAAKLIRGKDARISPPTYFSSGL